MRKFFTRLGKNFLDWLEVRLAKFLTFHSRPISTERVATWPDPLVKRPRLAVVIQGPVMKPGGFTLETARLYKRHFPAAIIILSTWQDEDQGYIHKIKSERIEVVLSPKPEYAGIANINFQITSSAAGVKKARELGAEYVLKTRTDQRIYAPNAGEFLCNLLAAFPPEGGFRQKGRIIGLSLNTFKYRLYGLSDMNIFGHADDMSLYWEIGLQPKSFAEGKDSPLKNQPGLHFPESYLAAGFLEKIGRQQAWTLKDSWQSFARNFCVIDQHSLDLYWPKYSKEREYRRLSYDGIRTDRELDFLEWFNLFKGLGNKDYSDAFSISTAFGDKLTSPK